MDFLWIVIGLTLLILGGNWLLKSAVGLSLRMNISRVVIGLTVVSFATSAPELIVSVKAALKGISDISVGNVVGSNIANIALVLGITLLLANIKVSKNFYKSDWPVMMFVSLLFYGLVFDGEISRWDGIIMFSLLILFIIYLFKFQKESIDLEELEDIPEKQSMPILAILAYLIIGGFSLWGGSELLIKGAVGLAKAFNVSDRIISITIISVGTSIPELAASVIAVLKKEKAISLGNLIGSNIFNILAVLGITSIIQPIRNIDENLLQNDMYWMLGIAFIILPLVLMPKTMRLNWKEGLVLLGLYVWFVYTSVWQ